MEGDDKIGPNLQPSYKRIYDYLYDEISLGKLAIGNKVPSEKELCHKFQVSRITSKRALEMLAEQGFISRFPGKGSFVTAVKAGELGKGAASSRLIGFIIPDFGDSFGTRLIHSIEENCSALGYNLLIKRTRDIAAEEEKAITALVEQNPAGILIVPVHSEYYNSEILKLILNKKALVFVDRNMRGLAVPSVCTDNIAAAELGVEYLFRLGHRNIAFYSGPIEYTSSIEDRHQGFMKAFIEFGVSYNPALLCAELSSSWIYPFYAGERVSSDVELIKNHLLAHPEITAAFTVEYNTALIVKSAVCALGYTVPKDFSILSFDAPAAFVGVPEFTHLYQDEYAIGKQAVDFLHRIIHGADPVSLQDVKIPAKLILGASTAPLNEEPYRFYSG
ncbi:MAG: GntR family transcriptional regulator [Spirochaetaceae bacterium]|jgi:DNA-binding LacI/PurR family transcriptional regulator|nr:GntR family transcriptional regulator [Spirochaetaceae bacterium]